MIIKNKHILHYEKLIIHVIKHIKTHKYFKNDLKRMTFVGARCARSERTINNDSWAL